MATNSSNLEVRVEGRDDLSPELDRIESRLIRFVGAIGAGIAAVRITTAPIRAAIELERELANVAKTANFNASQINSLRGELLRLSTDIDVSAVDLAKIAAAAGQQGLGREGVAGITAFTESVARMASVLDLTADQAAKDIGKVANIFKIPLLEIERAVSTFNEVSNNSTAEGEELLDVVKRIGDAAGRLNLQQSIALAATGLDFGQSPEVVGTAFAKVFTSLTQKAQDFGRLLYGETSGATEKWLAQLDTDGLKAFQSVLSKLRDLQPVAQQDTIVKLFGGGRIGALVNKLVSDTTDSVIKRNFASAQSGGQGLSAIREQAVVLNTLKAQGILTLNTLTKLGIDASQQLLSPLTKYVREFRAALEGPRVAAFMDAFAKGIGGAADAVANFVSFLASLRVNWENFLPLVAGFLGLKLAEALIGITRRFLGLGVGLKSISNDALSAASSITAVGAASTAAGAAAAAAEVKSRAARVAELLGYKELYDAIQRNQNAKREAAAQAATISRRQIELAAAEATAEQARIAAAGSLAASQARSRDTRTAQGNVGAAVRAQAAAEQAVQQQRNSRLQAAETAHVARMEAIQTNYQTQRRAIAATGTAVGLAALKRERDAAIAAEELSYTRSERAMQAYWARRLATTTANASAEVAVQRLAYLRTVQDFDEVMTQHAAAQRRLSGATAKENNAQSNLNAAQGLQIQSAAANANLQKQVGLLSFVASGWNGVKIAAGAALGVISAVGRFLLGAASIGIFIYQIADMVGLVDLMAAPLRRFGEAIGLVSYKRQEDILAQGAQKRAQEEEKARVDALTDAYRKLADGKSAPEFKKEVEAKTTILSTSDSQEKRGEALGGLVGLADGAEAELKKQMAQVDRAVGDTLRKVEADTVAARTRITTLQAEATATLAKIKPDTPEYSNERARFDAQIKASVLTYAALSAQLTRLQGEQAQASVGLKTTEQNLATAQEALAQAFTPQSVTLLKEYVVEIAKVREQTRTLQEQFKDLQANKVGADSKTAEDIAAEERRITDGVANNDNILATLTERLKEAIKVQAAVPGIAETTRKSLFDLLEYMKRTPKELTSIIAALSAVDVSFQTGANAGVNTNKTSRGDENFNADRDKAIALARRLSKAKLEVERAGHDAEANLQQERNTQVQASEDESYRRGLTGITTYYRDRERLQRANVDEEIRQRKADLKSIAAEQKAGGLDAADQKRLEAETIRLRGQIAVLEERKTGITAQTRRDLATARETFNQSVLQSTNVLAQQGLIPQSAISLYRSVLAELEQEAKQRFDSLVANGKNAIAFAEMDALRVRAATVVVDTVGGDIQQRINDVRQLQQGFENLRQQGQLTSIEAEAAADAQTRAALPGLRELLAVQEDQLLNLAGLEGSQAYIKLAQQIRATKLELDQLNLSTDATARSINQGVTDSLASSLANVRLTFNGIKEAAVDLLVTVATHLKQLFAKNLAETLMNNIGSGGGGGIGGFFSSLLKGGAGAKADGSNPGSALYVRVTTGKLDGVSALATSSENTATGIASLPGQIGGFFSALGGTFSGLFNTILAFLGTAFTSLISVILTTSAADKGSSVIGDFIGVAGSAIVAHSGGKIGSPFLARRLVAPSLFYGAERYHTGGVVGLKPNEVPLIGLKGEEMLTEDDPRHRDNLTEATGKNTGGGVVNVWLVSPDQAPAMGPNDIVMAVADNIQRGGSIKKLVQQVQMGR